MKNLKLVGSLGTSEIIINDNILNRVSKECFNLFSPTKVHIVTDENVSALYLKKVSSQFDITVSQTIIKAGEQYKTIDTIMNIYDDFIKADITRKDLIIALGGGVVGDITGFAASTFLRGVSLCQIPTTLLSQVDSSIGGKTGFDLPHGKNLVGTFYQPKLVLIDPQVLSTLKKEIYIDGMAEVIKYGCIKNNKILEMIKNNNYKTNISDIIYECLKIKRDIVEKDEHDIGERMILNFGHTIGHAIEKLGNYTKFSHGYAVSLGMIAAMKIAEQISGKKNKATNELFNIIEDIGLPTDIPYTNKQIFDALLSDKKKMGNIINFIIVNELGKAEIKKLKLDELHNLILKI